MNAENLRSSVSILTDRREEPKQTSEADDDDDDDVYLS